MVLIGSLWRFKSALARVHLLQARSRFDGVGIAALHTLQGVDAILFFDISFFLLVLRKKEAWSGALRL
jgi:hypothetical protein